MRGGSVLTTGHTCAATWRAARQAAEQVRNGKWVGETREGAEEAERQKREKGRSEPHTDRQTDKTGQ